jgi:hypothetical protein
MDGGISMSTTLNRRERKAVQLLAHYATCEKIGKALGMPNPDGKRISVALFKLEREAHKAMEHAYRYPEPFYSATFDQYFRFAASETAMDAYKARIEHVLKIKLGGKLPPGFFVNRDPKGAALNIDPENKLGKLLIDECGMHTDWGGNGILSPTINGDL